MHLQTPLQAGKQSQWRRNEHAWLIPDLSTVAPMLWSWHSVWPHSLEPTLYYPLDPGESFSCRYRDLATRCRISQTLDYFSSVCTTFIWSTANAVGRNARLACWNKAFWLWGIVSNDLRKRVNEHELHLYISVYTYISSLMIKLFLVLVPMEGWSDPGWLQQIYR